MLHHASFATDSLRNCSAHPKTLYNNSFYQSTAVPMNSKDIRYSEFLEHLPADTQEKSLIAIKGHLFLEVVLKEYIFERVKHPDRLRNKYISFANLIDFASSLEDNNNIQWVWKALRMANQIRNQLAHSLSPEKLDSRELEFVEYIIANDGELTVETTEELKFEKLNLAYFQLYDVILSSINLPDIQNTKSQPTHNSHSLDEIYQRVARAIAEVEKGKTAQRGIPKTEKCYAPPQSKNARKVW
jgi:hypothetical protein